MKNYIKLIILSAAFAVTSQAEASVSLKVKEKFESPTFTAFAYYGGSNLIDQIKDADYDADFICNLAISNNNILLQQLAYRDASPELRYDCMLNILENVNAWYTAGIMLVDNYPERVGAPMSTAQWDRLDSIVSNFVVKPTDGDTIQSLTAKYIVKNRKILPGWYATNLGTNYYAVNSLSTMLLDGGQNKTIRDVTEAKQLILNLALPRVKIVLRQEGKTFISTTDADGNVIVNPIEERMREVLTALNAPQCVGLEAALTSLGFTVEPIDRSRLNSTIPSYANDIMIGEKPFKLTGSIVTLLGVDGYNDWVKVYNEGEGN